MRKQNKQSELKEIRSLDMNGREIQIGDIVASDDTDCIGRVIALHENAAIYRTFACKQSGYQPWSKAWPCNQLYVMVEDISPSPPATIQNTKKNGV